MSDSESIRANVLYSDLREWIAEAEKLGELRLAEGYNWEEQIGMAAEILQHNENAPVALLIKFPASRKVTGSWSIFLAANVRI